MNHALRITHYDIYLVGVGGQGVLTIGNLITAAAVQQDVPVSFYPTKGMAQRGGAVKARLRLGRAGSGPNILEGGAALVIAMERSESLKGIRFLEPGGEFLLYDHVWPPAAVMLGKAEYPTLETVRDKVQEAGGKMHYLDPADLPLYEGSPVPANIYVLGAALGCTGLGDILEPSQVAQVVETRWRRGIERNLLAFQAGVEYHV